ncbi:hypothetical protein RFI_37017, partial [Reticulomyxa filosa]
MLSSEQAAETVRAFLLRKCNEIILHSLAAFHPLSKGNAYHGRVVLEIVLAAWPKTFFLNLTNEEDLQRFNALFRNLHQGNMNSFFIDLICFKPTEKIDDLQPVKEKWLNKLREWHFMEYLMDVSSSNKHGDDIATKYATFFIDLVARSASIDEAATLFYDHEEVIVDALVKALLDEDNTRTLWQRIICGQTLVQFLDICSRPTIINPAQAYADMLGLVPPDPSQNLLHQMFDVRYFLKS